MRRVTETPVIGQRVGWSETYRTNTNVVATRTEWGVVTAIHTNGNSDCDGYPVAGTYVIVDQTGFGRGLGAIHVDDLHTVYPL